MWKVLKHGKIEGATHVHALSREDLEGPPPGTVSAGDGTSAPNLLLLTSSQGAPGAVAVSVESEEGETLVHRKRSQKSHSSGSIKKKKVILEEEEGEEEEEGRVEEEVEEESYERLFADSPVDSGSKHGAGTSSLLEHTRPRALRDLTGAECQSLMEAQTAAIDLDKYDSMDPVELADDFCLSVQTERVKSLAIARQLKRAVANGKAKEKELLAAQGKCTDLEAELRRSQEAEAKLQAQKDSLSSEMERIVKGKEEELQTQRRSLQEEFRVQLSQLKEGQVEKENKAFLKGVREHRLRFFLTAQGHQFLRIMLENTLEATTRKHASCDRN